MTIVRERNLEIRVIKVKFTSNRTRGSQSDLGFQSCELSSAPYSRVETGAEEMA
jgi:hypothetical protein